MFGGSLSFLANSKGQLVCVALFALLTWLYTRSLLITVAEYTLCKREFKERMKGRSVVEFIFLTNLKDILPKYMFTLFYVQLAILPLSVLTVVALAVHFGRTQDAIVDAAGIVVLVMVLPMIIHWYFCVKHTQKDGNTPRFIPRRHVMTQKHTQPKRNSNRPKKNTKPKESSKESPNGKQE